MQMSNLQTQSLLMNLKWEAQAQPLGCLRAADLITTMVSEAKVTITVTVNGSNWSNQDHIGTSQPQSLGLNRGAGSAACTQKTI